MRKLSLSTPADYDSKPASSKAPREMYVNSTGQWKHIFSRLVKDVRDSFDSENMIDWDDTNDPGVILHACADDIKKLWHDPTIQTLLEMQKLRIEEVAGL